MTRERCSAPQANERHDRKPEAGQRVTIVIASVLSGQFVSDLSCSLSGRQVKRQQENVVYLFVKGELRNGVLTHFLAVLLEQQETCCRIWKNP